MSEHRVVMGKEQFQKLVCGGVVELRTARRNIVRVILKDIGFDVMERAIKHARCIQSAPECVDCARKFDE